MRTFLPERSRKRRSGLAWRLHRRTVRRICSLRNAYRGAVAAALRQFLRRARAPGMRSLPTSRSGQTVIFSSARYAVVRGKTTHTWSRHPEPRGRPGSREPAPGFAGAAGPLGIRGRSGSPSDRRRTSVPASSCRTAGARAVPSPASGALHRRADRDTPSCDHRWIVQ